MAPSVGYSGVHRAVVVDFDGRTLWGRLVYAPNEQGWTALDAIAAVMLANVSRTIDRDIARGTDLIEIAFHSTSVHGIGTSENWPRVGQMVDVHLNSDQKLVAV